MISLLLSCGNIWAIRSTWSGFMRRRFVVEEEGEARRERYQRRPRKERMARRRRVGTERPSSESEEGMLGWERRGGGVSGRGLTVGMVVGRVGRWGVQICRYCGLGRGSRL
jgi:hypothetical protein